MDVGHDNHAQQHAMPDGPGRILVDAGSDFQIGKSVEGVSDGCRDAEKLNMCATYTVRCGCECDV